MTTSSENYFRPGLERFCLWSAVPFVIASVLELALRKYAFGLNDIFQLRTTQMIYLLSFGAVHIYLTLFVLAGLPEMKTWSRETRILGLSFPRHMFALWLVFFLITFYGGALVASPSSWPVFYAMIFLMYVARLHHGLAQMQGISQIYNHATPTPSAAFVSFLRREKAAFSLLKISVLGALTVDIFTPAKFGAQAKVISMALFWIGLATSFYLLYNSYRQAGLKLRTKNFFLLRVFLYSLQAYSFIAIIGSLFTHSLEYFMVIDKMTINSSVETAKRKRLYLYVLLTVVPIMAFTLFRYIYVDRFSFMYVKSSLEHLENLRSGTGVVLLALVALNSSFDFVHYYLDRVVFRMRSVNSLKYAAPLLKGYWNEHGL